MRKLDKQSEFTGFISDTNKGLAGMVAGNAFYDLLANYAGDLANFPAYLDLVKVLKGTATDLEVDELITILTSYMGEYDDYETKLGQAPAISRTEFTALKENLPKLVKALSPILIADASYTQSTFGESYSLYYTYTLINNAKDLVIGHIPESIMPILKSLIPKPDEGSKEEAGEDTKEEPDEDVKEEVIEENKEDVKVPNSGSMSREEQSIKVYSYIAPLAVLIIIVGCCYSRKNSHD